MATEYSINDLPLRIASKIKINEVTGCWEWQAYTDPYGYGRITMSTHQVACHAHRIVYALLAAAIPEGLTLDHKCRVRHCVNPAHLEPVTNKVNVMRGFGVGAINSRKTHCIHGHEFDAMNTMHIPSNGQRTCRECIRIRQLAKKRGGIFLEALHSPEYQRKKIIKRRAPLRSSFCVDPVN